VVKNILRALKLLPTKNYQVKPVYFDGHFFRYSNKFDKLSAEDNNFENIDNTNLKDNIIDVGRGDLFLFPDLALDLIPAMKKTLYEYKNFGLDIYFIVYDILTIQHPEWFPKEIYRLFRQYLEIMAEISTGVICISKSSADYVKEWIDNNPPIRFNPLMLGYFHLGADFVENTVSSNDSGNIIANFSPFEPLRIKNILIIKLDHISDNILAIPAMRLIKNHFEELLYLYNICKLSVFPSWYEGFGLPVVEAMACGTPIICANATSLPEVIENEDAMFNPFDVNDISNKITKALTDDNFRTELISRGLKQSEKFSWDESAKIAIKLFEQFEGIENTLANNPVKNQINNKQILINKLICKIGSIDNKNFYNKDLKELTISLIKNFYVE